MSITDIKWVCTTADHELIERVVNRALADWPAGTEKPSRLELTMDITAVHLNGCALDLEKLLGFDAFNFLHDVGGMRRKLDRNTGQLTDFFLPRCALPAPPAPPVSPLWSVYELELRQSIADDPKAYHLKAGETPEAYCARVRKRFEREGVKNVGWRTLTFRRTAKALGVPFTLAGLQSQELPR